MALKRSTTYLRAAESVASGAVSYCCHALRTWDDRDYFAAVYDYPEPVRTDWHCSLGWYGDPGQPENQGARVLALLFAHEIAKDEERRRK